MEGFNVDAISSASRDSAIPIITKWVIERLDEKLGDEMASEGKRYSPNTY